MVDSLLQSELVPLRKSLCLGLLHIATITYVSAGVTQYTCQVFFFTIPYTMRRDLLKVASVLIS